MHDATTIIYAIAALLTAGAAFATALARLASALRRSEALPSRACKGAARRVHETRNAERR